MLEELRLCEFCETDLVNFDIMTHNFEAFLKR